MWNNLENYWENNNSKNYSENIKEIQIFVKQYTYSHLDKWHRSTGDTLNTSAQTLIIINSNKLALTYTISRNMQRYVERNNSGKWEN